MGERLAGGNTAIALLANTLATGAGLVALIMTFGPASGAHFNPLVTGVEWSGQAPHPRRRPAQPRLQLPVPARRRPGRGRLPHRPGRQHVHRLPAGRRADDPGEQLPAGQREGRRGHRRVGAGHRALPRVRTAARRGDPPLPAARRAVPVARVRHRGGHGGRPRGAGVHRQEDRDQGRRRLPRLVRHDGLRPAGARDVPDERQGHPLRRDQPDPRGLPERPDGVAPQARREPAARRHGGRRRGARRAGVGDPAGAVRGERRDPGAVRRVRGAARLRRGRHRLPARDGRRRRLLRCDARPDRARQGGLRRLSDGGRSATPTARLESSATI